MNTKNLRICICLMLILAAAFVPMTSQRASAANSSATWDTDADFDPGAFSSTVRVGAGNPAFVELDSTVDWTMTDYDAAPTGRTMTAMAYDSSIGDQVTVMFGGLSSERFLTDNVGPWPYGMSDTWEFDPSTGWTLTDAGTVPFRYAHAMVYDSTADRVLLFGGYGNTGVGWGYLNDLWEYDANMDAWNNLMLQGAPGSPSAREWHSMAYDDLNDVTILFGGDDAGGLKSDTWEYDYGTNTWTGPICDPCTPSARHFAPMSYDSANDVAILFGGTDGNWFTGPSYGDLTYEYDAGTNTWSLLPGSPVFPTPHGGAMVFDPILGESVLYGGYNTGSNMAEDTVWSYNRVADTWFFRSNTLTFRAFHAMAYDSSNSQSIVYGGATGMLYWFSSTYGDVYTYDSALNNWNDVYPLTNVPPPTYASSMTFDEASEESVMYSGYSMKGWTNRVWSYNAGTDVWTLQPPSMSFPLPSPRFAHTMVYSPITGESIMMGGVDANIVAPINFANDVWGYNLAANTWDSKNIGPPARANPGMAYSTSTDTIVLFGGVLSDVADTYYSDTWIYDPAADSWIDVSGSDTPPTGRYGHYMTYDKVNNLVIMFGGINSAGTLLQDTWTFDPVTYKWDQLTPAGTPSARTQGRMVFHEGMGCSLIYGGVDAAVFLDETYKYCYDASGGNWTEILSATQPDFGVDLMMSYDSVNNVVVYFGGQVTSSLLLNWGGTFELSATYLATGDYITPSFDAGGPVANWGDMIWTGSEPAGTNIQFQIATNTDNTTWNFIGPDGTAGTYYDGASGASIPIVSANHADDQYLQVKVFFDSNPAQTLSPKLDILTLTYNQYPNVPTLTAPIAGGIVFSDAPRFQWTFSDPDLGDTQMGFQVLVRDQFGATICNSSDVASTNEFWDYTTDPILCPNLLSDDTTYYWTARTQDQDGAWSAYATDEMFYVDLDPTSLLIGTPNYTAMGTTYFTSATPFDFTVVGAAAASTWYRVWTAGSWTALTEYTGSFTILPPDGTRYVEFNSTDFFGNHEGTQNYSVNPPALGLYLDDTPPTSTPLGISMPWYLDGVTGITYVSSATTFTMTLSDGAGSGVASSSYRSWDPIGGWTGLSSGSSFSLTGPDGARHIEYYSTDNLGNTETTNNRTNLFLDNTPPDTQLAIGTPNATVGGITFFTSGTQFTLSASDLGSGVAIGSTEYRIWDALMQWTGWTNTIPFQIMGPDGYRYIEYRSSDNVQNAETPKNYSAISELYLDNALPETTISWGAPNYTSGGNIYIRSSTDITLTVNKPAASIFYKLGIAGTTILYTGSFTIPTEGSITVYYNATDALGNIETPKQQAFIVDNSAPTTTITIIGHNATINNILNVGQTTEFRLTAVDNPTGLNCGVGKIWYKIDQTGVLTEYTGEFNLSGQTAGSHTIYFYSEDNLGNMEAQQSLLVSLDLTNPVANAGSDRTVSKGETVTLDGGGSSDNQGLGIITEYKWEIKKPDGSTEPPQTGESIDYVFDQAGEYTVTLTVTDAAGNEDVDTLKITVEEAGILGDFWWILLIIIAIIIVVIVVVVLMMRKKKPEEVPAAPPTEEAPAESPPGESPAEPPAEPPPG